MCITIYGTFYRCEQFSFAQWCNQTGIRMCAEIQGLLKWYCEFHNYYDFMVYINHQKKTPKSTKSYIKVAIHFRNCMIFHLFQENCIFTYDPMGFIPLSKNRIVEFRYDSKRMFKWNWNKTYTLSTHTHTERDTITMR